MLKGFLTCLFILGITSGLSLSRGKDESREASKKRFLLREGNFEREIDQKLFSLHSYLILSEKHFFSLHDPSAKADQHFQSLLVLKEQIESLQKELLQMHSLLKGEVSGELFERRLSSFANEGNLNSRTVSKLSFVLNRKGISYSSLPGKGEIDKELQKLSKKREFQICEMNLNHRSHMLAWGQTKGVLPSQELRNAVPDRQTQSKIRPKQFVWNIDSLDWQLQSPAKIVERTKQLMKDITQTSAVVVFPKSKVAMSGARN